MPIEYRKLDFNDNRVDSLFRFEIKQLKILSNFRIIVGGAMGKYSAITKTSVFISYFQPLLMWWRHLFFSRLNFCTRIWFLRARIFLIRHVVHGLFQIIPKEIILFYGLAFANVIHWWVSTTNIEERPHRFHLNKYIK